jgi:hypothetical protein
MRCPGVVLPRHSEPKINENNSRAVFLQSDLVRRDGNLREQRETASAEYQHHHSPHEPDSNFDALPASGSATWTNDSTLLGCYHARTSTGTTIVADDGTNPAGNLYAYGSGTNTDRSSIGSGGATAGDFYWGILLTNNSGVTIGSLGSPNGLVLLLDRSQAERNPGRVLKCR